MDCFTCDFFGFIDGPVCECPLPFWADQQHPRVIYPYTEGCKAHRDDD